MASLKYQLPPKTTVDVNDSIAFILPEKVYVHKKIYRSLLNHHSKINKYSFILFLTLEKNGLF